MTAQARRIVNHSLRILKQVDMEHLNEENRKLIEHLIKYLEDELYEEN